ncbi:sugar ABC transporter substrate-binding protein [Mesorhizobium sp. M3A.F.Ca.ET.080.04.2.1]|nr:sugar ABC transporter substrate-binding protein [Mesorhizobium sp. M3A.F.Ca.ET.080.04.2.1]RWF13099.1 MAG: sugar ABC transporter substrate-binding protein [Mesorhizobium sp.]
MSPASFAEFSTANIANLGGFSMKLINRWAYAGLAALAIVSTAGMLPARSEDAPLVVMLLPENVTARWEGQDKPMFTEAMKRAYPGARVKVENALNDASKQQAQAEAALASGAKVLVVTAIDQKGAAVIVNDAKRQGVPVIAYDRLIHNAPVAYYVSVDGVKIGELQGQFIADNTKEGGRIAIINGSKLDDNAFLFRKGYMSVLQPLFDKKSRVLVADPWVPLWDPSKAQAQMEQILTATNNGVDAVLSPNDGMAGGIIAALDGQQLAGKVPVTGLDGTLNSLQLILQGKQSMTVWRSLKDESNKTAQIVAALLKGETPSADLFGGAKMNNEMVDVPWAQVTPNVITLDNMNLVIEDGAVTKEAVCKGMPRVGPCKQ